MSAPPRPLVVYDEECRFCRAAARSVAWMDKQKAVAILGFNTPGAGPYRAMIPTADFERSWQLLLPDGRRLQAGAAALELMRLLPATRFVGGWLATLRLVWLVDWAYRAIARARPWLGRLVRDVPGPNRPP